MTMYPPLRPIAALIALGASLPFGASLSLHAAQSSPPAAAAPADLVVMDARIYTEDPARSLAQAMAIRAGQIVFVGSSANAQRWIGPATRVEKLAGKLVLPGLFDSHIHPPAIVKVDACDLDSARKSLRELTAFVKGCVAHYRTSPGQWLNVHQWNFADGNEPDSQHPTLRSALDQASTSIPIQLLGNDGHHGAFNSTALALAHDTRGQAIGLSRTALANEFASFRKLVGVDADGNPNGAVNEDARRLMGAPGSLLSELPQVMTRRAQLPKDLNAAGITGFMDAYVTPQTLGLYEALEHEGLLTARATLAQFYDPDQIRTPDGQVDWNRMISQAEGVRTRLASDPLLRADVVKLFADGVMEGNPRAVPPTPPETLALRPYLQPIFGHDTQGKLTVEGYVDTQSASCRDVRAHPAHYADTKALRQFMAAHGFHPDQCTLSSGQMQHDPAVIAEFIKRFHLAGFTLHIHVIGDGSLKVVLDALEAARAADGNSSQLDGLAHVQLAQPSDVARIGRDHLFIAFTYAWAYTDPDYDMTVIPFIDKVAGNSAAALHPPQGYYEQNAYPFKAVKEAGATLVAGSDAPVDTPDPRPFVNMAMAVTRRTPGDPPLNPRQAISLADVLDAYTINGARFLHRERQAGSLEVGKSADFIVLDQDILRLADTGRADQIARTHVLATWFQGKPVYTASAR